MQSKVLGQLEKPPEHTSEHVKSQNFLGGVPPDYITSHKGPYFLCLPKGPQMQAKPSTLDLPARPRP